VPEWEGIAVLPFGVEEELLLLDPDSGRNLPLSRPVRDAPPDEVRPLSRLAPGRQVRSGFRTRHSGHQPN